MIREQDFVQFDEIKQKEIGWRIQEARIAASISLQDLADFMGVSYNQWSKIENGKNQIQEKYLYMLPQILGVSVDYILYGNTKISDFKAITSILNKLDEVDLERARKVLEALYT